jgi:hypothetical protein
VRSVNAGSAWPSHCDTCLMFLPPSNSSDAQVCRKVWKLTRSTLHLKLALVAAVAGLVVWHMRRPQLHALEGGIFIGSLAIVWLGVSLAH